jgi:membrane protease YdiL (CAAX protease family)
MESAGRLMSHPAALRALVAYGVVWLPLLLVPPARELVSEQMRAFPASLGRGLWIGAVAGLLLVAADVALLRLDGRIALDGLRPVDAMVLWNLLFVVFLALTEEMLTRGVLLFRIERSGGPALAVLVTAVLFALAHFPGRELVWSRLLTYLLDGIFLGVLVLWTRDIWTAVGWHVAKNLAVAETFGGSYHLKEPLVRIERLAESARPASKELWIDLAAFAISVLVCLALVALTRNPEVVRHG